MFSFSPRSSARRSGGGTRQALIAAGVAPRPGWAAGPRRLGADLLRRHRLHEVARVVVVRDLPRAHAAQLVLLDEVHTVGDRMGTDVADERPAVQGRVVQPRRLRRAV